MTENVYLRSDAFIQAAQINKESRESKVLPWEQEKNFVDIFQTVCGEHDLKNEEREVPWAVFFEEASSVYQIPMELLTAVAEAESGFRADAVSAAGARGVMQLMPETAKALGVDDPFDPRSSILGGAKYLRQMLDNYKGDVSLALAAYNAGSGNVDKYGGIPPFQETRNYVQKIVSKLEFDSLPASESPYEDADVFQCEQNSQWKEFALYLVDMMRIRMQTYSSEEIQEII